MRKILLVLSLMMAIIACKKEDKALTPAEQALADDETIIEYLKNNRKVDFHLGEMANNIDWQIEKIPEEELETSENLYDIMSENVIETSYNGVDYKIYYYFVDEGAGSGNPTIDDQIVVDYIGYNLGSTIAFDYTNFSPYNFALNTLIPGWQEGLLLFKPGIKPEGFPLDFQFDPYREQIETPGRGFVFIPSGMAYGNIVRFDIVLYDVNSPEIEEL